MYNRDHDLFNVMSSICFPSISPSEASRLDQGSDCVQYFELGVIMFVPVFAGTQ